MFAQPPNEVLKAMWRKIPKHIMVTFLSAFFIGLITHLFIFTNTLPIHDQVRSLAGNLDWAEYQGRWLTEPLVLITGLFSLPWIHGFLSIVLLAISSCLVVLTTRVKGYVTCVLISAVMVTFPSVAGFFPYMHIAVAVFLSFMFACFAAFLAGRYKYGYLFAAIPIVLSMAIYQAFFSVTAALLIIILIIEVSRDQTSWQKTLFKGVKFVCTLGTGIVLYILSLRLFYPDGLETEYQALERLGHLPLFDLPNRLFTAYVEIARFFLVDGRNFHFSFMNIIFMLTFAACGILLVLWCIKKKLYKEPAKLILLGVLLFLLPLGCNLIYLMGPAEVHDLMIFGRAFILIFVIVVADLYFSENSSVRDWANTKLKRVLFVKVASISVWIITLAMSLTIYNYLIVSNQVYFKLNIAYQTTYAQSVLLVSRIQNIEGYTSDMVVVLVGLPHIPQGIPELEQITITGAIGPELFGSWSFAYFMQNYLNFTQSVSFIPSGLPWLFCDECHEIVNTINDLPELNCYECGECFECYECVECVELANAIRAMPMYPNNGSIAIINDAIFVRFPYIDHCCWYYWPRVLPVCCGR